jgi:hypothetical protein
MTSTAAGPSPETLSSRETPSLRDGDPSRAGALGRRARVRAACLARKSSILGWVD